MSVSPIDILNSARAMISAGEGEISVRNAISRAYYAVYHRARQTFPPAPEFMAGAGGGVHKAYIDQLQQAEKGSMERKVGVALNGMKGKRTKADYHLTDDIKPHEAAMLIIKAESLFADLENVAPTPDESLATVCTAPADSPLCQQDGARNRPALIRLK